MRRWQIILESMLLIAVIILIREIAFYGYSFYMLRQQEYIQVTSLEFLQGHQLRLDFFAWLMVTLVLVIVTVVLKLSIKKTFYLKLPALSQVLAALISGFGLVLLVNGVANVLATALELEIEVIKSQGMRGYTWPMLLLLVGILIPIFEELFFRGFILSRLLDVFNPSQVVVLSALLFSMAHFNLVQGLYLLPVGLLAGFLVMKSKSIASSVVLHSVFNITNIYIYNVGNFSYNLSQMLVISLIGLVLIIFSLYQFQ